MKEAGQEIEEEIARKAEKISNFISLNLDKEGIAARRTFANECDKNIIFPIAVKALYRIKTTLDENEWVDICKEAEQTLRDTITPMCNAYYTMYVPLARVIEEWGKRRIPC